MFRFPGLWIILTVIPMLSFSVQKSVETHWVLLSQKGLKSVYEYTVSCGGRSNRRKLTVIKPLAEKAAKAVWIFHGFQPEGDPYRQSPGWFIREWGLEGLAESNKIQFILPDMGDSLYPVSGKGLTDLEWLSNAAADISREYPERLPVLLIGVSTGVEGAVKTSGEMESDCELIALSGTFDFFTLPKESGEYRLHESAFGTDQTVWSNENPIILLKKGKISKIYLFCEEKSIYRPQAEEIASGFPKIEDYREMGNGFTHSWKFWGNPAVVHRLKEIITRSSGD